MPSNAITSLKIGDVQVSSVLRFDQTKAFGKHTVANLDVRYSRFDTGAVSTPWVAPEWTPVQMRMRDTDWYGYVHHGGVASDVRDASGSAVRYTLIGTSLPMNEERTRSWRSTSASALVRNVATEHRLRSVITPNRAIIDYYAQAGTSDWKLLKDMAARTGYRLWVDGATVLFVDPKLLLVGVRDIDIPTFSQSFTPGVADNMYAFSSKAGTNVPRVGGSTSKQIVYGLDPRTGRRIKATGATNLGDGSPNGPTPFLTHVVSGGVSSLSQAVSSVGAQVTVSDGWITATAVVRGNARLVPGSLVRIAGSGVPIEQQGRWLVTSVNHRVINDNSLTIDPFTTTLELERDQYYGPSFTSAVRLANTADTPPARIRSGIVWEADFLESINVG